MGWESRNGNYYYYRKRWLNGTCVSEYLGQGTLAQAIATLEREERKKEQIERRLWQRELEDIESVDQQIDELCTQIRKITQAVLKSTGHHRHKGQWRKKRMRDKKTNDNEIYDIVDRLQAGKGTKRDIERFKKELKEVPDVLNVFNMAKIAQRQTLDTLCGKDQALKLANKYILKNIKQELGYEGSSQLEHLLIEQIILCHIRLYWVEYLKTANLKDGTMKQIQHWEKRLNANQRRYFRAIETLARVRKLASRTPEILQVNIAQQQVNQVNQP